MEPYLKSSFRSSKILTQIFSTSFSASTGMIAKEIRQDIYNIYGLVRIADEVVDTYAGRQALDILDELEADVYRAIKLGFSANIIVQSFSETARKYNIPNSLIKPFFASMRMDLVKKTYTPDQYKKYIYGSADVVGLMCLMVFVGADKKEYNRLEKGARALGSAFQKINFLRDIKDDYENRERYYFPIGDYQSFDNKYKIMIEKDIQRDLDLAKIYIKKLPENSQKATHLAFVYYTKVFKKIKKSDVSIIKTKRVRINNFYKLVILFGVKIGLI